MTKPSARWAVLCVLLSVAAAPAAAATAVITNLWGSAEGIVSNRHQEHFWVTGDGRMHVLINDGSAGTALNLYSSQDGASWYVQSTIPGTDFKAQSDGDLVGDTLYLTYPTADGQLRLREYDYDRAVKTWTLSGDHLIAGNANHVLDRPTVALDATGRVWVAFADLDKETGSSIIKVTAQGNTLDEWNTPLQFGTRNASEIKSGRLAALSDGLMLVYTDGPHPDRDEYTLNWAYRRNADPLVAAWTSGGTLFTYAAGENDQFGCHFNVAVDRSDNVHIASRAADALIYFRISGYLPSWSAPHVLSAVPTLPYVQVSLSDLDEVFLLYPEKATRTVVALRSRTAGSSFDTVARLEYEPGTDLGSPRVESPTRFRRALPVLRQFERDGGFGLLFFGLDTSGLP